MDVVALGSDEADGLSELHDLLEVSSFSSDGPRDCPSPLATSPVARASGAANPLSRAAGFGDAARASCRRNLRALAELGAAGPAAPLAAPAGPGAPAGQLSQAGQLSGSYADLDRPDVWYERIQAARRA